MEILRSIKGVTKIEDIRVAKIPKESQAEPQALNLSKAKYAVRFKHSVSFFTEESYNNDIKAARLFSELMNKIVFPSTYKKIGIEIYDKIRYTYVQLSRIPECFEKKELCFLGFRCDFALRDQHGFYTGLSNIAYENLSIYDEEIENEEQNISTWEKIEYFKIDLGHLKDTFLIKVEFSKSPISKNGSEYIGIKYPSGVVEYSKKDTAFSSVIKNLERIENLSIFCDSEEIKIYKNSNITLVWCFLSDEYEFIYSSYKILDIFKTYDSEFIQLKNNKNNNIFCLDKINFSRRLYSVDGKCIVENEKAVQYAKEKFSLDKRNLQAYI